MIVAAALNYLGMIITMPPPARHHDLFHRMFLLQDDDEDSPRYLEYEEGFIDHMGVFYTREAAYRHCQLIGQPLVRRLALLEAGQNVYNGEKLFSEDLW